MRWFSRREPEDAMMLTTTHAVGNRELLLGLDHLYRGAMKHFEVERLLPAAEAVATALGVVPANAPVEGYYGESGDLTRYFQWMRALQQVPKGERDRVEALAEYQLLRAVTQSPIYGVPSDAPVLLPAGRDAVYFALAAMPPEDWSVAALTESARRESIARDDCSLVGLACRARDAVCIAALRESVVLYADVMCAIAARVVRIRYVWAVDPELATAANRFIEAFAAFVPDALPPAVPANAEQYFHASRNNNILGRCVRIGCDDRVKPVGQYHWAVDWAKDGYVTTDFWSGELWTTERYRRENRL